MIEIQTGKIVIDTEIEALVKLRDSLSKNFKEAIDILKKTRGKIVVSGIGKSGHIAKKISSTLSSVGSSSFFIHPSEANHGDLGMITKDECVIIISNSGETVELFNIILHCKKLKVPIISITSEGKSTLAKKSNICLEIPKNIEACPLELAPTSSTTASLVLGDALAITLLEKNDFTKKKFSALHPGGKLGRLLLRVKDIMKVGNEIPIVKKSQEMGEALIEITSKGLGCVGIISEESGDLLGIITDGDLRRHMDKKFLEKKIENVMTKNPKTLNGNELIADALNLMNKESITNFFITEKMKPVGVLHVHNILKF
ncbi:MAG: KpsF/GutQ family sugar-phosphate isomerase [Rickettsiales bacterium]|nr:KpsF/GutQ family sugar-phosphate isomerase [Rickettsiales bacterium]|tara:strand:- start:742 stop:1686 length:945 start_codon:yes stop_codon:yes gene_type:complete